MVVMVSPVPFAIPKCNEFATRPMKLTIARAAKLQARF